MPTPLEIIQTKRAEAVQRINSAGYLTSKVVHIGMATCEIAAGSKEVMEVFQEALQNGLNGVILRQKGCAGRCNLEPTVEITEPGKIPVKYGRVTKEIAREIIERHLKNGAIVKESVI